MKRIYAGSVGLGVLVCSLSTAQAALVDLGNGLLYDSVLGIEWLANANLSATNTFGVSTFSQVACDAGISCDGIADGTEFFSTGQPIAAGLMNWQTAKDWVAAVNAANYLGYNDWRLPTLGPINGVNFQYDPRYDGTHDRGYNISAPGTLYAGSTANEMAHLFYNTLGNVGRCPTNAVTVGDDCSPRNVGFGLENIGLFTSLVGGRYWTYVGSTVDDLRAFDFNFINGDQGTGYIGNLQYALLVRDSSLAAVPVPAAVWLFGSGLLGLVAVARRKS